MSSVAEEPHMILSAFIVPLNRRHFHSFSLQLEKLNLEMYHKLSMALGFATGVCKLVRVTSQNLLVGLWRRRAFKMHIFVYALCFYDRLTQHSIR